MNSPICVSNIRVPHRKHVASLKIAGLLLAIAPLWLMTAAGTSAYAQTTSSSADWTQFLRDNMQRWNPSETVLGVNNVSGLQLKWSFPLTANPNDEQSSSPAVVNGVVYIGSDDGSVFALNASTGERLWENGGPVFPDAVLSSPAVANGMVHVGTGEPNGGPSPPPSTLLTLNASTGAVLWSFAVGAESFVQGSPTVTNGVVYFGAVDPDGNVYALNASTGAKLWSFEATAVSSSPAVANGVVYAASLDGNLYALDANTGAKLWNYFTGGGIASSPAVANGVVYIFSSDGNVYAVNASNGAKLWSFGTGGSLYSSPAVANGVVYVGSLDHNVYALNASTGAKLWSFPTGDFVESSPAVANGVVYVGSNDGNIYALNGNTGSKLWSYSIGTAVLASPVVVDGMVYASSDARIYAFSVGADLFLRIEPTPTTVHQGDLITYAFPVWNLGPASADQEVLTTQVPEGTTFDYIRISGTPGLGTCTTPPYEGTGEIVCHENSAMAPNTTWTVRLTVKVTAPSGTVITENAATSSDTPDPNLANNTATVSTTVQ